MAKRNDKGKWDLKPQKSSAVQFLTYIASTGASDEKFEIRYEDENIWMSQKMLAAVYGVDLRTVSYHVNKIFKDAELEQDSVIQKYWITAEDGKRYNVNHYNLQVIIALGFKIDNERAIAFRKWANQIVSGYTIKGWVMDVPRLKEGSPITDKYFEHQLEHIREIRLSERKFYQKVTDLYATAIDYDRSSNMTRLFYATVQNRMHCAVHGHTAASIATLPSWRFRRRARRSRSGIGRSSASLTRAANMMSRTRASPRPPPLCRVRPCGTSRPSFATAFCPVRCHRAIGRFCASAIAPSIA